MPGEGEDEEDGGQAAGSESEQVEGPGNEEQPGADELEDGGDGIRRPCRAQSPIVVTDAIRDEHRLAGHVEYRNWCADCVQARGRRSAHHSRDERSSMPVLSWDYGYLGSRRAVGSEAEGPTEEECERDGHAPLMVMGDSQSKAYYGAIHPQKGFRFPEWEFVLAYWVGVLDSLGYRRVTMRSDNEPSLVAFLEKLKGAWPGEVVAEGSSVGDPQSNGAAEAGVGVVKGLVRTNKIALEEKLGQTIAEDHLCFSGSSDTPLLRTDGTR